MTVRAMQLAAVLLALFLGACEEEPSRPVVAEELLELDAANVLFDVRHVMTDEGVRQALVRADTAYTWQDSTSMALRGLELTVYTEEGRERAVVTGERGLLDRTTDRMVARGNVVLVIPDGNRRIESAELHYDPQNDRIWSDSATVMRQDGRIVEGTGFESDAQFLDLIVRDARTRGGVRF